MQISKFLRYIKHAFKPLNDFSKRRDSYNFKGFTNLRAFEFFNFKITYCLLACNRRGSREVCCPLFPVLVVDGHNDARPINECLTEVSDIRSFAADFRPVDFRVEVDPNAVCRRFILCRFIFFRSIFFFTKNSKKINFFCWVKKMAKCFDSNNFYFEFRSRDSNMIG